MSVDSSASNHSLLVVGCASTEEGVLVSTVLTSTKAILILPLCTFILYLGYQRWRQQRSFSASSHSDLFTYHLAAMELIWAFGFACYFLGEKIKNLALMKAGLCATILTLWGEVSFHILTCIEWYLAVVHPVTYVGLRSSYGLRVRNISILCVWMLCFAAMSIYGTVENYNATFTVFAVLPVSTLLTSFCSVSVLWALIRPGPGDGGRVKKQVDQSKQRALQTVMAISSMQWLWFTMYILANAFEMSPLIDKSFSCIFYISVIWFNLPNNLVLPLLYLHRAGKLPCCFSGHK